MRLLLALPLILSACAQLTFHSEGKIPTYIGPQKNHNYFVKVDGTKEFFFWGNVGPDIHVFVDDELGKQGVVSAANLKVHQYQSFSSYIWSLVSFGLYIPIDYRIEAFGILPDEDVRRIQRRQFQ